MKKYLLTLCLLLPLVCTNAYANTTDLFITDIHVDATSENSSLARSEALTLANRNALITIAKRLTTSDGVKKIESLTDEQIPNFIEAVSIVSEKNSPTRYIADLTVKIDENILKAYMEEQSIPLAVEEAANILIIPIFKQNSYSPPLLWEAENIWAEAWQGRTYKRGLSTFRSIDNSSSSLISAQEALSLDNIAIEKILRTYNTEYVYIVEASQGSNGGLNLMIMSSQSGSIETFHVPLNDHTSLLEEAIQETTSAIYNAHKKDIISQGQQKSNLSVLYKFNSLRDWVDAERRLKTISYIEALNIDAFGNGQVQFKIEFLGSKDNIIRALRSQGLHLSPEGDIYILEKRD